jgi:hypothetical protein
VRLVSVLIIHPLVAQSQRYRDDCGAVAKFPTIRVEFSRFSSSRLQDFGLLGGDLDLLGDFGWFQRDPIFGSELAFWRQERHAFLVMFASGLNPGSFRVAFQTYTGRSVS